MKALTDVSQTALITLRSRVIESLKKDPVLIDPVGRECLDRIINILPEDQQKQFLNQKLSSTLTQYIALRAREYDRVTEAFLREYPRGLVVSLGCGFDTRFWRLQDQNINYIEVDLPEVIEIKMEIMGDLITYTVIGSSVIEEEWISRIASIQSEGVLFLAEGLFMYLPKEDVITTFKRISETFSSSQMVFEVVHEKYTRGIWKKMVERKMKKSVGSAAGSSYNYGVRRARDIESYHRNIRVTGEWSYFEERDIKPAILRLFRSLKNVTRTQWTILAEIGQ